MSLNRLTFLVVDDLELMRTVTINQLRALGCEKVLAAKNGADALRMLRAHKVDAILSDWNMPVMTGLDLLRTVRADAKLSIIPFLMITAEAERQRIEEVISAGVSNLLVKPYSVGNLKARIERMLAEPGRGNAPVGNKPPTPTPKATSSLSVTGQPGTASDGGNSLPPTRLLIVDDTPASLLRTAQLFKDEWSVQTATSGPAALVACRAQPQPDLVLLDVLMPGMDGFEVVRQMRDDVNTAQIPVIFLTGMAADDEARLKGMALGAVDFVDKSMDTKVLRARVRNFTRFVDMRRQLQADYDAMAERAQLREQVENITRHDLKGSLAGIVGMVQTLADDEDMAPRHVEQLRMVEQTALQVINMVNLSAELYNIETGNFKLKAAPVEIGSVLRRIVEVSRSGFAEKDLAIVVDTDTPVGTEMPTAEADEMLCYSLFQNLIKNACEAAPNGTRVVVTLKDENPLRVLVQNTGVVPPDMRERFFDKFATSGKQGGSGLGTYSAHMLAKAQGGTMTMETSDKGNSTTLTVTLPRHVFEANTVAS
jgi:CheY-like chemotaxis protein/anti-sigma regulatory factor (Ser/Thr protein kinase)